MRFNYFAGIIALLFVFSSCKKKSENEVTPEPENPTTVAVQKYGRAIMHLHTFIGDEELDGYDDDISVPSSERRISMSFGTVYMSHFELVDMNNNIVKMCDTVLVKRPEVISYYINKISVGKYKALRFKVDFDSTVRIKITSGAEEPISAVAHFKGKLDTANTPDANNARVEYEYSILPRTQSIQVALPSRGTGKEFNIQETGIEYFHLYMDLNVLFSGIKMNDPKNLKVVSVEENKSMIADKIATNISNMFRYE